MRLKHAAAALVAGVAALATTGAASTAHASTRPTALPLPGYGAVAVDNTHKHVFISSGATGNSIVVTDFSGHITKTINSEPGAYGLALSGDDTKLYVGLSQGDGISVIDTTTLQQTTRLATGSQTCPTYIARTDTLFWYGYGCENDFQGKIGKLDTSTDPPTLKPDQQGDAIFDRAPLVASAAPRDAGPLIAGQLTLSLSNLHVYNVNNGTLDPGNAGEVVGSNLNDISVTSDGVTMFTASGSRDHVEAFTTATLSRDGAYATAVHPNAVTVSPDNNYLAMAPGSGNDNANGVLVYQVGASQPVNIADDWTSGTIVATRGIAWAGDLSKLFVITQPDNATTPTLHVIAHPTQPPNDDDGHGGRICILFICL
jgi:YVTN family beta-propeller protein